MISVNTEIDEKHEIIYDGDCRLCNDTVHFINKRDKRRQFRFSTLDSVNGHIHSDNYDMDINDFNSVIYIKNSKYYQKSTAALNILKDLGGIYKLLYMFIIIPKPVRDFVYNLIAKNRHRK